MRREAHTPMSQQAAKAGDHGFSERARFDLVPMCSPGIGAAFIGDARRPSPSDAAIGKLLSGSLPSKLVLVTTRLLEETRLACAAICKVQHTGVLSMHMPVGC